MLRPLGTIFSISEFPAVASDKTSQGNGGNACNMHGTWSQCSAGGWCGHSNQNHVFVRGFKDHISSSELGAGDSLLFVQHGPGPQLTSASPVVGTRSSKAIKGAAEGGEVWISVHGLRMPLWSGMLLPCRVRHPVPCVLLQRRRKPLVRFPLKTALADARRLGHGCPTWLNLAFMNSIAGAVALAGPWFKNCRWLLPTVKMWMHPTAPLHETLERQLGGRASQTGSTSLRRRTLRMGSEGGRLTRLQSISSNRSVSCADHSKVHILQSSLGPEGASLCAGIPNQNPPLQEGLVAGLLRVAGPACSLDGGEPRLQHVQVLGAGACGQVSSQGCAIRGHSHWQQRLTLDTAQTRPKVWCWGRRASNWRGGG